MARSTRTLYKVALDREHRGEKKEPRAVMFAATFTVSPKQMSLDGEPIASVVRNEAPPTNNGWVLDYRSRFTMEGLHDRGWRLTMLDAWETFVEDRKGRVRQAEDALNDANAKMSAALSEHSRWKRNGHGSFKPV